MKTRKDTGIELVEYNSTSMSKWRNFKSWGN
jgi:hypothetical protein